MILMIKLYLNLIEIVDAHVYVLIDLIWMLNWLVNQDKKILDVLFGILLLIIKALFIGVIKVSMSMGREMNYDTR